MTRSMSRGRAKPGGLFDGELGVAAVIRGSGSRAQGHNPAEFVTVEQMHRCDLTETLGGQRPSTSPEISRIDNDIGLGTPSVLECVHPSTLRSAMPASTTMTIRLSTEVKDKLDRLANDTRRSKSFLAGEAIATYVERELAIIEGIKRGIADVEAGRLVAHDEAMAEIDAAIEDAKAHKT